MQSFKLPSVVGRAVTVLGAGVLGRRIAGTWALAGYDVNIRDPGAEHAAAALEYCRGVVADAASPGSVKAFADLAPAVERAWLVIEAVPEKLQLKREIFSGLAELAPRDALLGSNSSSFNSRNMVDGLPLDVKRRVFNMHYQMPPINNVVELMTDGSTDAAIFPFVAGELRKVGMSPYVARKESTGLIFNRLWAAVKRETLGIIAEGVATPAELDQIWAEVTGSRGTGPAAMMDKVGLDTVYFIEEHYVEERGLDDAALKFLTQYIEEGRLGNKSDKGGLYPPAAGITA